MFSNKCVPDTHKPLVFPFSHLHGVLVLATRPGQEGQAGHRSNVTIPRGDPVCAPRCVPPMWAVLAPVHGVAAEDRLEPVQFGFFFLIKETRQ